MSTAPDQVWDETDVVHRRRRPHPAVAVRRRRQPAVAAGRRVQRRLPLRQPQQRQVPRRARRLDRRQRPAGAVHLQRHRRAVLQRQRLRRRHRPRRPATRRTSAPTSRCSTRRCRRPTIQSKINSVYSTAADQPVRQPAQRPAVHARHVQRRRPGRLLHRGRRPRPVARRTSRSPAAACTWTGHTSDGNATQNFWRDVENMSVSPSSGSTMWAVSQADPFRRMDVHGGMLLYDNTHGSSGNWSSGGYIGDSRISGQINSGTQQQFLTQDTAMTAAGPAPTGTWSSSATTTPRAPASPTRPTPRSRRARPRARSRSCTSTTPATGRCSSPALRTNAQGPDWTNGTAGRDLDPDRPVLHRQGR